MKAKEKRRNIFKKYASNLRDCLEYNGMCLATKSDNVFKRIYEEIYVCPLCEGFYYENSIYQTNKRQAILTLEHNPPDNVGGIANILTCAICNNTNGSKLDKVVHTYLKTEDFIKGKDGAKIAARFKFNNYIFGGELELNKGKPNFAYIDKKTNEFGFSKLINHSVSKKPNKLSLEIKLADSNILNQSLLKIAHLTAFKYLGYSYLFNHSGYNTIRVIKGILKHPNESYGVLGFEFKNEHVGLSIINEPIELRSFLIVQKVKVQGKERNVGIVLPANYDEGFNSLANFNNYINKEVQLSLEKFEFKNFPCRVDTFCNMFA